MILRQLSLYLYRYKLKELDRIQQRRHKYTKCTDDELLRTVINDMGYITKINKNKMIFKTYLQLRRFRRSNSFEILKNELMEIRTGSRYYNNIGRGLSHPIWMLDEEPIPNIYDNNLEIDKIDFDDNEVITMKDKTSGKSIVDFDDNSVPAFATRALNKINECENKPIQYEVIEPSNDIIDINKRLLDINNKIISSACMHTLYIDASKPISSEREIIDSDGNKLIAIEPIPNSDAYVERRLGRISQIIK